MICYPSKPGRGRGRTSPRLEALEERNCPSASISVFFGTMLVIGDSSDNVVTISDSGSGGVTASITSSSNIVTRTASHIRNILVLTGDGDDTVNYTLTGTLSGFHSLSVNLGGG